MAVTSWGAVNAVLNRLVREGVIAGFRTNLGDARATAGLHVIASAPELVDRRKPSYDPEKVVALRQRIARDLSRCAPGVTVTVEGSPDS